MRADESPAAELLLAMEAEMAQLYDGLDLRSDTMPSATATDFAAPGGVFLVGWLDDRPVACGGVKDLHVDGACEIKRMYVTPQARGGTVGRDLLAALEAAAAGSATASCGWTPVPANQAWRGCTGRPATATSPTSTATRSPPTSGRSR